MFQLEDKIGVVEGRGYARRIDGLDAGEAHTFSISDALERRKPGA